MRHILYACQESLSKSSAIIRRVVINLECHQLDGIKHSWTDVYHVLTVSWLDPSIEGFFVSVLAIINFRLGN